MKKKILIIGEPRWNTESRAIGAKEDGWEVRWSIPAWTKGMPLWRRYFQYQFRSGPDIYSYNKRLLSNIISTPPSIIWVEEPYFLFPETLSAIKRKTGALLVCAYSDDPRDPAKKSRHFDNSIGIYDFIFTTKDDLQQKYFNEGCKYTGKFWKGYDPRRIYKISLNQEDLNKYQSTVAFIGHADFVHGHSMRQVPLLTLASQVTNMKIWGRSWSKVRWPKNLKKVIHPYQLDGLEYTKAISGSSMAIQIPSRLAQDTHSSRSVEIPACGTLLVAERTVDHQILFEEGKEAVFFGSISELVDKVNYYLNHENIRIKIAQAGYKRCVNSGYSNPEQMKKMIKVICERLI